MNEHINFCSRFAVQWLMYKLYGWLGYNIAKFHVLSWAAKWYKEAKQLHLPSLLDDFWLCDIWWVLCPPKASDVTSTEGNEPWVGWVFMDWFSKPFPPMTTNQKAPRTYKATGVVQQYCYIINHRLKHKHYETEWKRAVFFDTYFIATWNVIYKIFSLYQVPTNRQNCSLYLTNW